MCHDIYKIYGKLPCGTVFIEIVLLLNFDN